MFSKLGHNRGFRRFRLLLLPFGVYFIVRVCIFNYLGDELHSDYIIDLYVRECGRTVHNLCDDE